MMLPCCRSPWVNSLFCSNATPPPVSRRSVIRSRLARAVCTPSGRVPKSSGPIGEGGDHAAHPDVEEHRVAERDGLPVGFRAVKPMDLEAEQGRERTHLGELALLDDAVEVAHVGGPLILHLGEPGPHGGRLEPGPFRLRVPPGLWRERAHQLVHPAHRIIGSGGAVEHDEPGPVRGRGAVADDAATGAILPFVRRVALFGLAEGDRLDLHRRASSVPHVDLGADFEEPDQHRGVGVEAEPAGPGLHPRAGALRVGDHRRG